MSTCMNCREDWVSQIGDLRAFNFDESHPGCECEKFVVSTGGLPVADDDLLARLIVSPQDWTDEGSVLLWVKLRAAWRAGLSFFRSGTRADDVRNQVIALTKNGPVPQTLVGAILTTAGKVRSTAANPERTYCVYDTDAVEFTAHADAIARGSLIVPGTTKNKAEKISAIATRALRAELESTIIKGSSADELINALRSEGFELID